MATNAKRHKFLNTPCVDCFKTSSSDVELTEMWHLLPVWHSVHQYHGSVYKTYVCVSMFLCWSDVIRFRCISSPVHSFVIVCMP